MLAKGMYIIYTDREDDCYRNIGSKEVMNITRQAKKRIENIK